MYHGGPDQVTTSLGRRLQRLEANRRFIQQEAFQHLSGHELRFLIDATKALQQGRELTSQEAAAAEAFAAALEQECQKAGFK